MDELPQSSSEHSSARTNVFRDLVYEGANRLQQASQEKVEPGELLSTSESTTREDLEEVHEPIELIRALIREGNAERVLLALKTAATRNDFVRHASTADFENAICTLDPEFLVEPYKEVLRHARISSSREGRLKTSKSMLARFRDFSGLLNALISQRQETGQQVTMPVCRHLLQCAAAVGDAYMANRVFTELIPGLDEKPDLECYNHYLTAIIWNRSYGRKARFSLRVVHPHLELRQTPVRLRPRAFRGYSVPGGNVAEDHTIRSHALQLFRGLLSQGLKANETTFTNLMIAMAREGDIAAAESILKSVWNIDTQMLASFDEEEIESPTFYDDGHPLQPSEKLLFAIVHSYAINNRILDGFALLDYTSRNYNLPVSERIWSHLMEWAFVLSIRRSPALLKKGYGIGQLRVGEFEKLFTTMMDEPHHIKPDSLIFSFRFRTWRSRRHLNNAEESIRKEKALVESSISEMEQAMNDLLSVLRPLQSSSKSKIVPSEVLESRRRFLNQYLLTSMQLDLLRRDVRNLLYEADFAGSGRYFHWSAGRLPKLSEEFEAYLPDLVGYKTPTGSVLLSSRSHRNIAIRKKWKNLFQKAEIIFVACDTDENPVLIENLRKLPFTMQNQEESSVGTQQIDTQYLDLENRPENQVPLYEFGDGHEPSRIINNNPIPVRNLPDAKKELRKRKDRAVSVQALRNSETVSSARRRYSAR